MKKIIHHQPILAVYKLMQSLYKKIMKRILYSAIDMNYLFFFEYGLKLVIAK